VQQWLQNKRKNSVIEFSVNGLSNASLDKGDDWNAADGGFMVDLTNTFRETKKAEFLNFDECDWTKNEL